MSLSCDTMWFGVLFMTESATSFSILSFIEKLGII